MLTVAGDMTPEGGEESKVGERSAGENIVTMVTMEQDMEEVSEDNAAEAQDYFKEGYSSELAQVFLSCLYHKSITLTTPFQVEAFLDENPDFFKDYLIRKASRHMIDSWLVAHSLPPGHCLPISPKSGSSSPHTR